MNNKILKIKIGRLLKKDIKKIAHQWIDQGKSLHSIASFYHTKPGHVRLILYRFGYTKKLYKKTDLNEILNNLPMYLKEKLNKRVIQGLKAGKIFRYCQVCSKPFLTFHFKDEVKCRQCRLLSIDEEFERMDNI